MESGGANSVYTVAHATLWWMWGRIACGKCKQPPKEGRSLPTREKGLCRIFPRISHIAMICLGSIGACFFNQPLKHKRLC